MTVLGLLICVLSTALASALHGGDTVNKAVAMALHAACCVGGAFLLGMGWWCLLGIPAALYYWAAYRRGTQAQAELTAMDTLNHPPHTLATRRWKCVEAYALPIAVTIFICTGIFLFAELPLWLGFVLLPTIIVSRLCVTAANYSTGFGRWLGWEKGYFSVRRFTETITGAAPGGLSVALILYGLAHLI